MPELRSVIRLCLATAIGLVLWTGFFSAQAQERELKVGYTKNPIQDASLDMMEKWAKDHGVKLTRVPMAYSVFMEKVTTTLTGGTDQFDVIWHNDDWGQLWQKWLETTDDVKGIENADRWPLLARRYLDLARIHIDTCEPDMAFHALGTTPRGPAAGHCPPGTSITEEP